MGRVGGGQVVDRLTALAVGRTKAPGLLADGGGLYLQIAAAGAKSWIFRYRHAGRRRDMGLGPYPTVGLADARARAMDARRTLSAGQDPIEARNASTSARAAAAARATTFRDAALACIADRRGGWRNAKHVDQWEATLETYAFPTLGRLSVAAIDTALVLKVLKPIWTRKTETASRVRGRIEAVLDWAKAHKLREGENPARWRGGLDRVLPKRSDVKAVVHHPALPYDRVGAFMKALRAQEGTAARALELLILTATRTREAIHAQWEEFDLDGAAWTVPPERTKTKRPLRIPLSAAALAVLEAMEPQETGHVFPGGRRGKPLSTNALLALLKRMDRSDITAHGFRSSFRDWAAALTNFPRELAEHALGHNVGSKVERAYQRDDLLAKRVKLMGAWATYCGTGPKADNVVSIKRA